MTAYINAVKSVKTKFIPKFTNWFGTGFANKYLLYTNVAISVSLSGLGDILEQRYEILHHDLETWDKTRTRNMSLSGLSIGVICHYWYRFLDKRYPGYHLRTVFKKIVIDQVVCSPITIATMFVVVGLLERQGRREISEEIRKKAWRLYVAEWVVWPPAQFVNFYFIPLRYRVLYDNLISLGYDVYTSHVRYCVPAEGKEC